MDSELKGSPRSEVERRSDVASSDLHFYIQMGTIFVVMILCMIAIIVSPSGPNVQYFESIATFCLGLFLPNPQQNNMNPDKKLNKN